MNHAEKLLVLATAAVFSGCASQAIRYDTILRGGTVYDGSGEAPYVADVAIEGDRIAVDPDDWFGFRDRSWGIREHVGLDPVGT